MLRSLRLAAVGAVTFALVQSPAYAQDPIVDAPKEKKICKTEVATGSIRPKRTCYTKKQWDSITERSQSDLERTRAMDRSKALVEPYRGQ